MGIRESLGRDLPLGTDPQRRSPDPPFPGVAGGGGGSVRDPTATAATGACAERWMPSASRSAGPTFAGTSWMRPPSIRNWNPGRPPGWRTSAPYTAATGADWPAGAKGGCLSDQNGLPRGAAAAAQSRHAAQERPRFRKPVERPAGGDEVLDPADRPAMGTHPAALAPCLPSGRRGEWRAGIARPAGLLSALEDGPGTPRRTVTAPETVRHPGPWAVAALMRCCGREFSEPEMQGIRALIARHPDWTRAELSRQVCDLLGWHRLDGGLKDMSCRVAMLRMHRAGRIERPPPRPAPPRPAAIPFTRATAPQAPIRRPLHRLPQLASVSTAAESRLWHEYIERYHYLRHRPCPVPSGADSRPSTDRSWPH